ncbi:hypothetical protein PBCV1_a469L [Paramecium bursaria Chlorella virus 1]|uniref:Uncharacterized protein n=1 Tax=Paramecium bursaria Chlorella virus 1 TaxID=10506 RepID=Q98519_PBCV1|nr:hypothetical protein PBCV1_a469L [Paramecium bursaria Chlorella virus 1]AAC96836.1 hypothetical protein [Paramecium bursaria Chlorella virus 1]
MVFLIAADLLTILSISKKLSLDELGVGGGSFRSSADLSSTSSGNNSSMSFLGNLITSPLNCEHRQYFRPTSSSFLE